MELDDHPETRNDTYGACMACIQGVKSWILGEKKSLETNNCTLQNKHSFCCSQQPTLRVLMNQ